MFFWGMKGIKKAALLLGISKHQDEKYNLKGPKNDLQDFASLLESVYRFRDVLILNDETCTKDNILSSIEFLYQYDLTIFYYSGHGSRIFHVGPEGTEYIECLLSYDHNWQNPLCDYELKEKFLHCRNLYTVFDCCHSGGLSREGEGRIRGVSAPTTIIIDVARRPRIIPNNIELAACLETEVAWERLLAGKERGVFTWTQCQILQENSKIELEPLQEELRKRITSQTPRILPIIERKIFT